MDSKRILLTLIAAGLLSIPFFMGGCGEGITGNAAATILPVPTGLTIEATTMQISLSWEAVAGAASYNVYWSNTSGVTINNGNKQTNVPKPFIHSGLINGQTYYYIVTALDSASQESAASVQISAVPQDIGTSDTTLSDGTHSGFVVYEQGVQSAGDSILALSNGEFLAIGNVYNTDNDMAIRKYKADGSLDTSFSTVGQVTYDRGHDDFPAKAMLDPLGRILITGYSANATDADMIIWRYNADGTPDNTFDTGGVVIYNSGKDDYGNAITLDGSGNIFVTGSINNGTNSDIAVWKYDTNGSPVFSFGLNGRAIYPTGDSSFGNAIKITADGIYVAGSTGTWGSTRGIIVRFDQTGNADVSFGTGGSALTSFGDSDINAMDIDSSGRIVAAGRSGSDMSLWRFNSGGITDTSFGSGGKQIYANGTFYDLLFDSVGRILAGGGNSVGFSDQRFVVARYNQNGSLDTTFGTNGLAILDNGKIGYANGMAFDSYGRLLLIGNTFYSVEGMMICRFK